MKSTISGDFGGMQHNRGTKTAPTPDRPSSPETAMYKTIAILALSSILVPAAQAQCLTTLFAANGGTAVGGAMYFDLTATQPILIDSLELNLLASPGTPVDVEVYLRSGTSAGFESSPAGWSLVGTSDGSATSNGFDVPTSMTLSAPVHVSTGLSGVAIVAVGSGHARTNGNGANQTYSDGVVTLELGTSSNAPFSGTAFSPRVWNGTICYREVVGTPYCSPAAPNSTSESATLTVVGSTVVADNELALVVTDLPPTVFVLPLISSTTGSVPMAGGSQGTLCLGGSSAIGRLNGLFAAASISGVFDASVDLTTLPAPTGASSVMTGDTWSFQAWYRDTNPMSTSNFSSAVTVDF